MKSDWKRELFLDRQFEANTLKIGGVGLESSIDDIDYLDITEIYVEKKIQTNCDLKTELNY